MAARIAKIDKSIKTAVGGPIVAVGYYAVVVILRYISCLPTYVDAEFAGIPVAQFLLLALTVAALFLIVFAMLGGFRLYRQSIRARSGAARKTGRWGLGGMALGAIAFAAVLAGALPTLTAVCR